MTDRTTKIMKTTQFVLRTSVRSPIVLKHSELNSLDYCNQQHQGKNLDVGAKNFSPLRPSILQPDEKYLYLLNIPVGKMDNQGRNPQPCHGLELMQRRSAETRRHS